MYSSDCVPSEDTTQYNQLNLTQCSYPSITISLSESVSHGNDMWRIGSKANRGFTNEDIMRVYRSLPEGSCELVNLKDFLPKTLYDIPDAFILIIRNQLKEKADRIYNPMISIEGNNEQGVITGVEWDSQRFSGNKIVENTLNKKLLFLDIGEYYKYPFNQFERRGTIYNIRRLPELLDVTTSLSNLMMIPFYVEGTNYYNTSECYTPLSQNKESKCQLNIHLGTSLPLHFRWYHLNMAVSDLKSIQINHGDIYLMNEIALGNVKESKTKLYLKHGMGLNSKCYQK